MQFSVCWLQIWFVNRMNLTDIPVTEIFIFLKPKDCFDERYCRLEVSVVICITFKSRYTGISELYTSLSLLIQVRYYWVGLLYFYFNLKFVLILEKTDSTSGEKGVIRLFCLKKKKICKVAFRNPSWGKPKVLFHVSHWQKWITVKCDWKQNC